MFKVLHFYAFLLDYIWIDTVLSAFLGKLPSILDLHFLRCILIMSFTVVEHALMSDEC